MNSEPVSVPELVPVFPLPEAVLFPRQLLPLHIFEPRYRAMVADALAGERFIAVALLKPHYEPHYFTAHAPVHRFLGVGRIIGSEKLDGGKYNILLRGEARAQLLEELPGRTYRLARIKTLQSHSNGSSALRARLRRELCEAVRRHLIVPAQPCEEHASSFEAPLSLGELVDLLASQLLIVGELGQCLLAELETCTRATMLLRQIETVGTVARNASGATRRVAWDLN